MYILGINPGHNGTAALIKDGKLIACVSEERFSRIKNHFGFPKLSIKYVLEYAGINARDINYIILTSVEYDLSKEGGKFNIFQESYTNKSLWKKAFGFLCYKYPSLMDRIIKTKHKFINFNKRQKILSKNIDYASKFFGLSKDKIIYIDHHMAHSYACCFNLPRNEKSLIFSIDGEGDGLCATVNIFDGKSLKRISKTTKEASLGYLYGLITLYLGMKPNQHEFKVMGMAPYAKEENIKEIYELLEKIIWVDELKFKSQFRMQYVDFFLDKNLKYKRFDNICGAVQKLTEELLCLWVKNAILKTGINSIALCGGVMMNVKACQKISEMTEVKNMFVMPSSGDESLAIGLGYYGYKLFCERNNIKFEPKPIEDLYLGPEYFNKEIKEFLVENNFDKKYKIKEIREIEKEIARLLGKNEIVARMDGRSEWGARALGNRSILANPTNKKSVIILNELIKDRDFWMPFTPSMLDTDSYKYIINPRKIEAPYMVITFNSTKNGQEKLAAAIHPYDYTVRPQVVYKKWNLSYYKIISEFKKISGIGAVLNTSFNLHGEPNVLSPKDAMHTFENSGLKYLAIGNFLIEKTK